MNKKILSVLTMAAAMMLNAAAPAQAAPITYQLDQVTFTDGTAATGSLVFDADTHSSSFYNISTTQGVMSAFTWDNADSGLYFNGGFGSNNFVLITSDGRRVFNFSFLAPFTDAGGTNLFDLGNTYECDNCGTFRRVNGGSVTSLDADPASVPEPGTMALTLAALALLGFIQHRRNPAA